jgi:hypothetical protein
VEEKKSNSQLSLNITKHSTRTIVLKPYHKKNEAPLFSFALFFSAGKRILSYFTIKKEHTHPFLYHSLFTDLSVSLFLIQRTKRQTNSILTHSSLALKKTK